MAEASISLDQDRFNCLICLDLMKDPVTAPCGHSYCMVCINTSWNHQRRVYSCPHCRESFNPKPVLRRNNMLAEVVQKLKAELEASASASAATPYAGPGDLECDLCTGRKRKATESCLTCVATFCETHLKPHTESPALKKHKLVKATKLQEKMCPQHDEVLKIYCRTDQSCICYLCMLHEHKGHDTVAAVAEKNVKERELKRVLRKSNQRISDNQKKVKELKMSANTIKSCAQIAVDDSMIIFTELISFMEKKRSEITKMIRNLLKSELNRNERMIKQLEAEIVNIKKSVTKLEELSHTKDPTQFLQRFQSLPVSTEMEDSPSITAVHHLSFDQMRKSLTDLKNGIEKFCKEEFTKIIPHDFCYLTLNPDTTHRNLTLSEDNRVVTHSWSEQPYTDHPERFDYYWQVLSKEAVSGRCYWEVEWNSLYAVSLAVSYKDVSRKGHGRECEFGRNTQSWCLECSASCLSFWHNNIRTKLQHFSPPRIGVYVDHSAGTLSFYSISDTMTLLHSVQTQFTQPLYAGFGVYWGMGTLLSFLSNVGSTVKLCDPN